MKARRLMRAGALESRSAQGQMIDRHREKHVFAHLHSVIRYSVIDSGILVSSFGFVELGFRAHRF
jgi:hypothetical protein